MRKFPFKIECIQTDSWKNLKLRKAHKAALKNNGNVLTHISDVPPNNLTNGKLKRSINRLNNYETERGDWFFASSAPT